MDYTKIRCTGCDGETKRWQTKKAGPNQGKYFLKCAKPVNRECLAFFEWEEFLYLINRDSIQMVRFRYDPRGSDGDEMPVPRDQGTTWTTSSASPARTPFQDDDHWDHDHWRDIPESNIPDRD